MNESEVVMNLEEFVLQVDEHLLDQQSFQIFLWCYLVIVIGIGVLMQLLVLKIIIFNTKCDGL